MRDLERTSILLVGDFMIQHRAEESTISNTHTLLESAELRIGNIDTVLSPMGHSGDKWSSVRGHRESIGDIKAMGFDVVTLANNHAMDFGPDGLLDMVQGFAEVGIKSIGAGRNLEEARTPHEVQMGPKRFAIFSVACTLPPGSAAGPNTPGISPVRIHQSYSVNTSLAAEQPGSAPKVVTWVDESDLDAVTRQIDEVSCRVDHVLVVIHWGVPQPWRAPFDPQLQDYQLALGRALVDAGADAVIGNHPHELHAMEMYDGALIAYSLGNFWIDTIAQRGWMARESVAIRLTFGSGTRPKIEILPLLLDDRGYPQYDPDKKAIELLRHMSSDIEISDHAVDKWHRVREFAGVE